MSLYLLNVTIHVLAALFWLGGMFFLGLVGAPVLRSVDPPALRAELFRRLGEGFRNAGWIAIAVLIITGVISLKLRGLLEAELLSSSAFWRTPIGHALLGKLLAVTAMVTISAVHDFAHGPRASRAVPGSPAALRLRRQAALIARTNGLIGIALVYFAVRLARGG